MTRAEEIAPGRPRSYRVAGRRVLLCRVEGRLHAVEDRCSHDESPLAGGTLDGCVIECPRHGARFDVRDGRVLAPPARHPLASFAVREVEGRVEVALTPLPRG